MKILNINDLKIGEGMPKICVPIVADEMEKIKEQTIEAENTSADILELRVDFFEKSEDVEFIKRAIKMVKENSVKPLILTYRSGFEGGEKNIERADYTKLLMDVLDEAEFEIIDIELFAGKEFTEKLVKKAHENGVKVIMSNHDFSKTPDKSEIVNRLEQMYNAGADIAKIAVMPTDKKDVATLILATAEASEKLNVPVVTMSMSGMGLASRITGEQFGSSITFGAMSKVSAPGQINVEELKNILEIIHKNMIGETNEL